jgi:hypothetical protein
MSTAATYNRSVDDALQAVALARFGAEAAVNVVRYLDRNPDSRERVTWYALGLKRSPDAEFEILGRRKTRGELLGLIEKAS